MNPSDLLAANTHRPVSSRVRTWTYAVIATLIALAGILACYWDTVNSLVWTWLGSSSYNHSFIVFPVSAWLIWLRRRELVVIAPRPCWWVLFALGGLSMLWLLGNLASIETFQHFALVVSVPLLLWAVLGTQFASTVAFPLAFMVFAWPFGEFLIPPLIDWTADFTVTALQVTGVPVFRQGNTFAIPTGSWSVVEACSGVRYLIAALCAGSLFAYLTYRSWIRRWIFFGACVLVPIIANWLRAYLTVLLGHLTNNRLAAGVDHLIYGWIFFGFVMTIVFYVGSRWREPSAPDLPSSTQGGRSKPLSRARFASVATAAIAFAAVGPALAFALQERATVKSSDVHLSTPTADGPWQPTKDGLTNWESPFRNPTAVLRQAYRNDHDEGLELAIAFYRNQRADAKLLSLANTRLADYAGPWAMVDRRPLEISNGTGTLEVIEKRLQLTGSPGQNLLVWEWYWVAGLEAATISRAKLAQVRGRILGQGDDSGAVVLLAPYRESPTAAREALVSFVRQMHQPIVRSLADTAAQ